MKVYMKPIRMIACFNENGEPSPIRFQMKDENKETVTIKIDHVSEKREEKLAGNRMLVFKCQSTIDEVEKVYELKYEVNSMKFYLYKM